MAERSSLFNERRLKFHRKTDFSLIATPFTCRSDSRIAHRELCKRHAPYKQKNRSTEAFQTPPLNELTKLVYHIQKYVSRHANLNLNFCSFFTINASVYAVFLVRKLKNMCKLLLGCGNTTRIFAFNNPCQLPR